MAQRAEDQIQVTQVLGSMLTKVTFPIARCLVFHVVKPVMPILAVLPISGNL